MPKDARAILIAVLACFLVLFVTQLVGRRDAVATLTEEIRVGDGHVAHDVYKHNDGALGH